MSKETQTVTVPKFLIVELDQTLNSLGVMISNLCAEAKLDAEQITDILRNADYGRTHLEIINDAAEHAETRGLELITDLRMSLREVV